MKKHGPVRIRIILNKEDIRRQIEIELLTACRLAYQTARNRPGLDDLDLNFRDNGDDDHAEML